MYVCVCGGQPSIPILSHNQKTANITSIIICSLIHTLPTSYFMCWFISFVVLMLCTKNYVSIHSVLQNNLLIHSHTAQISLSQERAIKLKCPVTFSLLRFTTIYIISQMFLLTYLTMKDCEVAGIGISQLIIEAKQPRQSS